MHKIINRTLIIVALILVGWYFLQSKINSPEECQKIAGIWNEQKATCEQTTAQIIYENLASAHPITMSYPESGVQVKIDKVENVDDSFYLRGHYQSLLQAATSTEEALYDRGFVYLNMSKMVIINEQSDGLVSFVAPFIINTSGSGVFVYTGLFSFDLHSKKSTHLDSALIGNRIREETITYINDHLQVDFKSHAKGQALADYPTQKSAIYLQIDSGYVNFKIVKRMHSSWDNDNDGMNDCELDGSCDHSIDYSLPRASDETK